jgi:DNA-binding CsgD family transcriptional regulator
LDDYVLAGASAVIVASVVILATLLSRYSRAVQEAEKSIRLGKDVWDSMNSRFSVVDARIIDLMAKTEVLSSRLSSGQGKSQVSGAPNPPVSTPNEEDNQRAERSRVVQPSLQSAGSTETEFKVLNLLAEGPKSSAEIKALVGRSREHIARLMKTLFDRGLVARNDKSKPYVYEITESGRTYLTS